MEEKVSGPISAEKYQKLLQEYSKLKTQNSVLKKGVLQVNFLSKESTKYRQEQEKNKALEIQMKDKEDKIRCVVFLSSDIKAFPKDVYGRNR